MHTAEQCLQWAELRLAGHRKRLEIMSLNEQQSIELRSRIDELKVLLAAIRNEKPPVWIDPED